MRVKKISLTLFFIVLTLSTTLVSLNFPLLANAQNNALSQIEKKDNIHSTAVDPMISHEVGGTETTSLNDETFTFFDGNLDNMLDKYPKSIERLLALIKDGLNNTVCDQLKAVLQEIDTIIRTGGGGILNPDDIVKLLEARDKIMKAINNLDCR